MSGQEIVESNGKTHSGQQNGAKQQYGTIPASEDEVGEVSIDDGSTSCLEKIYPDGFLFHLKALWVIGWPITIIQITQFLFGTVAVIFCGHLDTISLDAVALANSLLNVAGISIATGLSTACDTLFAQIYGSTNKRLIGVVLQRSILIMFLTCLPCWAIHLNTEQLLLVLGQHPDVSRLTGTYMLICMPGLMFFFIYCAIVKYLQGQNIVYPSMILGVIAFLLNALLHYILLFVMEMGTDGSAIAQSVSYSVMCLLNIGYVLITGIYKYTWSGWTSECWQEWGIFFKLALGGLFMVCIEWWAFEVGVILSGTLGTVDLGAQSILFQLDMIWYTFPLGVSVSCSITTGQFLGAGNAKKAKTAARVGLTVAVILGLFFCMLWITLRDYLPLMFSSDDAVVHLVSQVLPILGVYTVFDGIACTCGGVLRGTGKQHVGAVVVLIGYVCGLAIGLPSMMLTRFGIAGFWTGLAVALFVDGIVYYTFIHFSDWNKLVIEALERTKSNPFEAGSGAYDGGREIDNGSEKDPLLPKRIESEPQVDHYQLSRSGNQADTGENSETGMPVVRRAYSREISAGANLGFTRRISQYQADAGAPVSIGTTHLTTSQLLLRRGLFVLVCVACLVAGVIARIYTEVEGAQVTNATTTQLPTLPTNMQVATTEPYWLNYSSIP